MLDCVWGGRSAKFGVMVCKASMLDCRGVDLPADLDRYAKFEFPDV